MFWPLKSSYGIINTEVRRQHVSRGKNWLSADSDQVFLAYGEMDKAKIEQILHSAGFRNTNSSGFGHTYRFDLSDKQSIRGFAHVEGVGFFGPRADPTKIKSVDFKVEAGGTTYRFHSGEALIKHLDEMISALRRVSENPDLLRCPWCGVRNVHMKEPLSSSGKQFKPFLSCDGMQVQRSGKKKEIACNGTSNKLPALVNYE